MIKKTIKIPTYGHVRVHLLVGKDIKDMYATCKNLGFQDTIKSCDGLVAFLEDSTDTYIFINVNSSIGTLAHECFHVVVRIMNIVGSQLTYESEEPYAYLLSYLVNEVNKVKDN